MGTPNLPISSTDFFPTTYSVLSSVQGAFTCHPHCNFHLWIFFFFTACWLFSWKLDTITSCSHYNIDSKYYYLSSSRGGNWFLERWSSLVEAIQQGLETKQALFKTVFMCHLLSGTWLPPHNYSPPGFSVHGIFQARILEWFASFPL